MSVPILHANIEVSAKLNNAYRKVVYTDHNMQVVLMSLLPSEDIPLESHHLTTQFIRVESGNGIAVVDNTQYELSDGVAITIPPDTQHRIINGTSGQMKLYTIYSPPVHKPNTYQALKSDSE